MKFFSLFSLVISVLLPLTSQAKENEFLPEDYVLKFAPDEFISELVYLNETVTYENVVLCEQDRFNDGCSASSLTKYAIDPNSYKVTAVQYDGETLSVRKVYGAEEIFLSRYDQFLQEGKEKALKKAKKIYKKADLDKKKVANQ